MTDSKGTKIDAGDILYTSQARDYKIQYLGGIKFERITFSNPDAKSSIFNLSEKAMLESKWIKEDRHS